jgi:hypothetical protein
VRLQKETCSDKSEARQQQKQSCTKKNKRQLMLVSCWPNHD